MVKKISLKEPFQKSHFCHLIMKKRKDVIMSGN